MKTLGYENVLEDFNSEHADDPDAMKNAQKRIEYGKNWCTTHEWKFLYGRIEDDVRTFWFIDSYSHLLQGAMEDVYMGPLIIKTFAAHYNFATPSKTIPNYDVGVPIGGIALAVTAVSNNQIFLHILICLEGGTCTKVVL
jgi:hypothetical protein